MNGKIFEEKVIEHKMCKNLSVTSLITRRTEQDIVKYVYLPSCKVPVIPDGF